MKQSLQYLYETDDTILPIYPRASYFPSDEVRQHFEQADAYERQNCFEKALEECDTVIQLAPDFADVHNLRGIILEALGRKDEAISAYREAVRLDPTFREAKENLQDAKAELKKTGSYPANTT